MQKPLFPLKASVLGFVAIFIIVIGSWNIFPVTMSQTLSPQEQVSASELSAAINSQKQVAAKLTRSATFNQRFQKLSDEAQKKGTVSVIVKVRAPFQPEGKISSAAQRKAQRSVIAESQDRLLTGMSYGPTSLKKYDVVPYIAMSVDSAGLAQLQASVDVLDVGSDMVLKLASGENLTQVGATNAWFWGYTGAGKTIAILDSGVDKSHTELSNKVVAEACFSTTDDTKQHISVCPGGVSPSFDVNSALPCTVTDPSDVINCGHGTNIAGIAAGSAGVAKDANIISVQVMAQSNNPDECGFGSCLVASSSDLISALQHINDISGSYDISAVNVSLVTDLANSYQNTCDDADGGAIKDIIDQLRSVGIAVVAPSGNDKFSDAIRYPACVSTAISVGAVGDGVGDTAADEVWASSNSANFLNLLAPGVGITSAIPGGGDVTASGTSQAAAHVSGAWALLKQQQDTPTMKATVDEVLNKLISTGKPITDPRNTNNPIPRIQIDAALGVTAPDDRWVVAYYNTMNLDHDGPPVYVGNDGNGFIDHNFSGVSPAPGLGTENYSIRWTRTLAFTQGTYYFSVTGDDGVRLYVDGILDIEHWVDQSPTTYDINVPLDAGYHMITLEYYQHGGGAQARLTWRLSNAACHQAVAADRWNGEYFNNIYLAGSTIMTRDDGGGDLNMDWADGSPSSDCNVFADYFSVRWTRTVNFEANSYRFTVSNIDDGVRLYIDGQLWIDKWVLGAGTQTADVPLTGGDHVIRLEYYENTGLARANVSWAPLPIPPSNLGAVAVLDTIINLSWLDNSIDEQGFYIERWNGSSYVQIGQVGANVTSYSDAGRAASTAYSYRVRAFNSIGNSMYSNESSATTYSPPSNLVANAVAPSQINLSWTDGGNYENGFSIERWNGSSYAQISTVGANIITYTDSGLIPSTTYSYRVRAFNGFGYSGYTNESGVTTPPCGYSLNPTSARVGIDGGSFSVSVVTDAACSWTAGYNNGNNSSWISFSPGGGAGNGAVQVYVGANPGAPRSGSLIIAGKIFVINEDGCSVSPPNSCP